MERFFTVQETHTTYSQGPCYAHLPLCENVVLQVLLGSRCRRQAQADDQGSCARQGGVPVIAQAVAQVVHTQGIVEPLLSSGAVGTVILAHPCSSPSKVSNVALCKQEEQERS